MPLAPGCSEVTAVRTINATITVICLVLLGAPFCHAATPAKLQVSATVAPFYSFNAIQNVASYQVNSADLKRGYIDLPNTITVKVRTNLTAGVPVFVENSAATRVLIKESGRSGFAENAFTVQTSDYRPNTPLSKSYDLRIVLSNDATEGNFPLVLSISPAI